MLTREQLRAECRKIFDALPDRGETIDGVDDAVLKLNKQAAMAMDLQAENDRLKADVVKLKRANVYLNLNCALNNPEHWEAILAELATLKSKLDKIRDWTDFWEYDIKDQCGMAAYDTLLSFLYEKGE